MDKIFVPSKTTRNELTTKNVPTKKITLFTHGVDIEHFTPTKRNKTLKHFGISDGPNLLYVEHVSREKNLHLLKETFLKLRGSHPGANLVVAKDDPYAAEMKSKLANKGAVFTNYLQNEDLAQVYASNDLFVFPNTTDTFGNVVLKAQTSGLPVIVTGQEKPRKNVTEGVTELVMEDAYAEELARTIEELVRNEANKLCMERTARTTMEDHSFDHAFIETWKLYHCAY